MCFTVYQKHSKQLRVSGARRDAFLVEQLHEKVRAAGELVLLKAVMCAPEEDFKGSALGRSLRFTELSQMTKQLALGSGGESQYPDLLQCL